jgi:hypothetical protein
MRPLGHTDARAERDDVLLDPRLRDAWHAYLDHARHGSARPEERFERAITMLAPLCPSIPALHQHILKASPFHSLPDSELLGVFTSAGYALAAAECIIYDLSTPQLCFLGMMCEKDIVITGKVGSYAGFKMMGTLTNHGTVGHNAGESMIGTFTNNGWTGERSGFGMTGIYDNARHAAHAAAFRLGNNNGRWNVWEGQREAFCRDIANPKGLDHNALESLLRRRYARWRK